MRRIIIEIEKTRDGDLARIGIDWGESTDPDENEVGDQIQIYVTASLRTNKRTAGFGRSHKSLEDAVRISTADKEAREKGLN